MPHTVHKETPRKFQKSTQNRLRPNLDTKVSHEVDLWIPGSATWSPGVPKFNLMFLKLTGFDTRYKSSKQATNQQSPEETNSKHVC